MEYCEHICICAIVQISEKQPPYMQGFKAEGKVG